MVVWVNVSVRGQVMMPTVALRSQIKKIWAEAAEKSKRSSMHLKDRMLKNSLQIPKRI